MVDLFGWQNPIEVGTQDLIRFLNKRRTFLNAIDNLEIMNIIAGSFDKIKNNPGDFLAELGSLNYIMNVDSKDLIIRMVLSSDDFIMTAEEYLNQLYFDRSIESTTEESEESTL